MPLTREDLEQIAEGIDHFVIDGDPRNRQIWQRYIDELRAEAKLRPASDQAPAVLVFPVVGADGPQWSLTQGWIDEWRALFTDLDVLAQCRAALAWITASPTRRKTAKGMPRFLVGWLTRSNDRGGRIADTRVIARPRGQAPAHVIGEAWRDECRRKHGGTCASKDLCQRRLLSEFQGRKDGKTGEAF